MTLQALGRRHLAAMIDTTIDLARETAALISADPDLILAAPPVINALVFRFEAWAWGPATVDAINREIRRGLLSDGKALLAGTKIDGRVWLKLTMLNPRTTLAHMRVLLKHVTDAGHALLAAMPRSA
jgi:L-2,4-diaminobutyrate decarboxylase